MTIMLVINIVITTMVMIQIMMEMVMNDTIMLLLLLLMTMMPFIYNYDKITYELFVSEYGTTQVDGMRKNIAEAPSRILEIS